MDFIKVQGTGNDFVLINAGDLGRDWSALARDMCDRRFGVGSDGLILLLASDVADLRMRMFNPDGSEAEACGNGLRCLARYAIDTGLVNGAEFSVETSAGMRTVRSRPEEGLLVSMGIPVFDPDQIPVVIEGRSPGDRTPVIDYSIAAGGRDVSVSCVSMGNPHAVCFPDEPVDDFPLAEIGPEVERHRAFPNRVNFEVVNVIGRSKLKARVWERGAGETMSCGSGACAAAVISKFKGLSDSLVDITLPGGTLNVTWDGTGEVLLGGPAEIVFKGVWIR